MPGAEQAEHFAAKIAGEKPVNLIHAPNQPAGYMLEDFAAQKALEIHAGTATWVGNVGLNIKVELLGYALGQGNQEPLDGLQVGGVELLEVGEHDLASELARFLQAACHQGSFSHLA